MRAILFVLIVFDEVLAGQHNGVPIHGIGEAEIGILLDAHAATGDLGQTRETDLCVCVCEKKFQSSIRFEELRVKGRTAG